MSGEREVLVRGTMTFSEAPDAEGNVRVMIEYGPGTSSAHGRTRFVAASAIVEVPAAAPPSPPAGPFLLDGPVVPLKVGDDVVGYVLKHRVADGYVFAVNIAGSMTVGDDRSAGDFSIEERLARLEAQAHPPVAIEPIVRAILDRSIGPGAPRR